MSGNYQPDDDAQQGGIWATTFLSNRDLSSQVPVNFVPRPGVYLTSACFSNGTYTASVTGKCVSNLLAAQFRRLVLDLYWDERNGQFGFCPVAVPAAFVSDYQSTSLTASALSSASLERAVRQARATSAGISSSTISSVTDGPSNTTSSTRPSSASTTAPPPITTLPSINGEILYHLGPYACSPSLDLSFFISVISGYLSATSDTVQAKLLYLTFNLHAAASRADPTGPAPAPTAFPRPDVLVGAQFSSLEHSPIYRPHDLDADRRNLNASWFKTADSIWPMAAYFNTERVAGGNLASSDGWPNEDYVQLTVAKRMFLAWGTIDPQLARYNFSGDSSTVFTSSQLSYLHQIQASASGELSSGCYYRAGTSTVNVSSDNSSWASTSYDDNDFQNPSLVSNITSCGISPVLNTSLTPDGASSNIAPYVSITHSAIWNWAPGEPRNTSAPGVDLDAPESQFRCAYFDASSTQGRWFVQDCLHKYRVACRVSNAPYKWSLSSDAVPFGSAPAVCAGNSSFGVPRTGLENTYLYQHILSVRGGDAGSNSSDPAGVWINFNSLDLQTCWVATGPNGTCPYYNDPGAMQSRQVLVPTIAAIIVLILTALTLFVKCNANRRNSKNRRRGEGGWDYEGVPS